MTHRLKQTFKDPVVIFLIVILIIVIGFAVRKYNRMQYPIACTELTPFSPETGEQCPNYDEKKVKEVGCADGNLFNTLTGESCRDAEENKDANQETPAEISGS